MCMYSKQHFYNWRHFLFTAKTSPLVNLICGTSFHVFFFSHLSDCVFFNSLISWSYSFGNDHLLYVFGQDILQVLVLIRSLRKTSFFAHLCLYAKFVTQKVQSVGQSCWLYNKLAYSKIRLFISSYFYSRNKLLIANYSSKNRVR